MLKRLGWLIAFIVLPLLAVLIPAWPQLVKLPKSLQHEVLAMSPLGPTQARGFSGLRLLKDDKPIETPYLASVRIWNAGDEPIQASDFHTPITIRGSFGLTIKDLKGFPPITVVPAGREKQGFVDVLVANREPGNIQVNAAIVGDEVRISPLLLNPRDEFVLQILINGEPNEIVAEARIVGVKEITRVTDKPSTARPISRVRGWLLVSVAFMIITLAMTSASLGFLALGKWRSVVLFIFGGVTGIATGLLLLTGLEALDAFPVRLSFVLGFIALAALLAWLISYVARRQLGGGPGQ